MTKQTLHLIILVSLTINIMGDKLGTLEQVLKPSSMDVTKEAISIVDGANFYIYSTKNLSLIRKFGSKGTGPGELTVSPFLSNSIKRIKDSYFAEGGRKVIFFSKQGTLIKEYRKKTLTFQTLPLKKGFLGLRTSPPSNGKAAQLVLSIMDMEMKVLKDLVYADLAQQGKKVGMVPDTIHFTVYDEKIFVEDSQSGFVISVFDYDGNKLKQIKHNIEGRELTQKDKDNILEDFKADPLVKAQSKQLGGWKNFKKVVTFKYPAKFPPIQDMVITGNLIYITTFLTKADKEECIIMNMEGKIKEKIFIPKVPRASFLSKMMGRDAKLHGIHDGTLYYLQENEENEEWEIHFQKIL